MKWQLRFGNGKLVLNSMLICCLWVCAVPAAARAQAKFSSATCSVTKVTVGSGSSWKISGTAQVTGLNPQNASTSVTFTFQSRANANAPWTDLSITVTQTTNGVNGTANFDSGLQNIAPPAQGAQYRTSVSGFYIDGNGRMVTIPGIASTPITPNP